VVVLSKYRIALDVMGGDYAPMAILKGAKAALVDCADLYLYLVGDEKSITSALKRIGFDDAIIKRTEIIHSSNVVAMEDRATVVLKEKKDASVCVAARLVADGLADGLVSMGHTGAAVVASMRIIGILPSVDRPCLASVMPNMTGKPTVLLDVGAYLTCKPEHIAQFAVMGSVYAEEVLNVHRPRVGVLSVGEEDGKGSSTTKEANNFLRQLNLNFLGNAEGRDIWNGKFDVIACDGFVGNAILKSSEALAEGLLNRLLFTFKENWYSKLSGILALSTLRRFKRKLDYSEYGGAPLLGIKGITIIGHGRSNANAVKNAINAAVTANKHKVNEQIQQSLAHTLSKA
jgi:glycerol-3-phosphate acyltransferase PlsX